MNLYTYIYVAWICIAVSACIGYGIYLLVRFQRAKIKRKREREAAAQAPAEAGTFNGGRFPEVNVDDPSPQQPNPHHHSRRHRTSGAETGYGLYPSAAGRGPLAAVAPATVLRNQLYDSESGSDSQEAVVGGGAADGNDASSASSASSVYGQPESGAAGGDHSASASAHHRHRHYHSQTRRHYPEAIPNEFIQSHPSFSVNGYHYYSREPSRRGSRAALAAGSGSNNNNSTSATASAGVNPLDASKIITGRLCAADGDGRGGGATDVYGPPAYYIPRDPQEGCHSPVKKVGATNKSKLQRKSKEADASAAAAGDDVPERPRRRHADASTASDIGTDSQADCVELIMDNQQGAADADESKRNS